MRDTFIEILGSVSRNKLRTCLTGLAVSWGIFMLIVLVGAGNGILNATLGNMEGISANTMEVWSGWTSKAYGGFKQGRFIPLTEADVRLTRSDAFADHIDDVIPHQSKGGLTMTYGKKHFDISATGTTAGDIKVNKIVMEAGRFLNDLDNSQKRKVVVITHTHAKNFLKGSTDYESLIGQRVKIGNLSFKIIGVRHGRENENDTEVYMPFSTMAALYAKNNEIYEIDFTFHGLETEEENEAFEKRYTAIMNKSHHAAPDDERAINIWNRFTMNMQMNKARNILETALWVIGLFTLLSGIVGVSNIMLITVKERTHEFGIRKAIGASPWAITRLIIAESVTITAFFGYLGMLLGMVACEVLDATVGSSSVQIFGESIQIMKNPTVSVGTAIGVTIVLILAGTIAGLFPAIKATKVRPIEALRAD